MSGPSPGSGRRAKRSLAQNFLIDPNIQRKIVDLVAIEPDDVVLEIGPGHGELSRHMIGRARRLILVEKDRDLARRLTEEWGGRADVEVHEADALDLDLGALAGGDARLRIVSNVPYNITSPLVFAFLAVRPVPLRIVITIQSEVAERIVAGPGGKTYGALSVGVQALADAELAFRIGRGAFRPVPEVDSAVVRIEPRAESVARVDGTALRALTRACFNRRRKQLQKILRTAPELDVPGDVHELLRSLGIDPAARPETLAPSRFVELADALGDWRKGARRGGGGAGGGPR